MKLMHHHKYLLVIIIIINNNYTYSLSEMLIDEVKISISSASVLRDFLVGIGKSSSDKVIASSLLITTGGVCNVVWPCPFCCSSCQQ